MALGQLALRAPAQLCQRVDLADVCFRALHTEPPGIRAAVQGTISALSAAFVSCKGECDTDSPYDGKSYMQCWFEIICESTLSEVKAIAGETRQKLTALLLDTVSSSNDAVKLCSAQWATKLFEFQYVPARYICIILAGDEKLDVHTAAVAGLEHTATGEFVHLQACSFVI